MKTKLEIAPTRDLQLASPTNLPSVQHKVGILGRFNANRALSKEASRVLTELVTARLQAEERVGKTQIGISEATIKGALVAEGMASIGTLAVDIATKTGAVQSRLTATAAAERITHVENRAESYTAIDARQAQNRLSSDEAVALRSYSDADLVNDIERTNNRIGRSKDAVESVHDLALNGLGRAADLIR